MDTKSAAIGLVAAALIGYIIHAVALPALLAVAIGGVVGALLPHREDSQTAAGGFLLSAIVMLIPLGGVELPAGLALFGYTVARHT